MIKIESIFDHPQLVPVVATWIVEQWSFLAPEMSIEAWTEYIQELIASGQGQATLLIAMDDSTPIGCFGMYPDDPATSIEDLGPWIGALYIEEKYRGTNAARKLTETLLESARQMEVKTVYAVVTDPKLIKIAHRRGWKTIKEEFYKTRQSTVIALDL